MFITRRTGFNHFGGFAVSSAIDFWLVGIRFENRGPFIMSTLRIVGMILLFVAIGLGIFSWFGSGKATISSELLQKNFVEDRIKVQAELDIRMYSASGILAAVIGFAGIFMFIRCKTSGQIKLFNCKAKMEWFNSRGIKSCLVRSTT